VASGAAPDPALEPARDAFHPLDPAIEPLDPAIEPLDRALDAARLGGEVGTAR
jgi:hypothetical protein